MKKINIILSVNIFCLFIPYDGAFQYLSHLLIISTMVFFYDYFKLKPIIYLYAFGMLVFSIQYIFFHKDVYLTNYLMSFVYAPLLVLLFPSKRMYDYTIDLEKILKISFVIYALLLWYQAITNWWTPESVGGVHGIIKGPHLNAQLYLLLSGYILFKEGYKNKLYALFFLLTALLCSFNLATMIFFVSVIIVLFVNVKLNKKYFKYVALASLVLLVGIFVVFKIVTEQNPYLLTMFYAISNDLGYSGKFVFISNFFTDYIQRDLASFIIGTSPGNGGSRTALLLTDNFLSVNIPDALISESFFVKENVYPYLYGVSDVTRGTINQPFSSLIAVISEYGIIVSLFFFTYIYQFYKKIEVISTYSYKFIIINLLIWLLFNHSLELLPFVVLFHLLMLSNKK